MNLELTAMIDHEILEVTYTELKNQIGVLYII